MEGLRRWKWIDGYDLRRAAGCLVAEVSLMARHVHQG